MKKKRHAVKAILAPWDKCMLLMWRSKKTREGTGITMSLAIISKFCPLPRLTLRNQMPIEPLALLFLQLENTEYI